MMVAVAVGLVGFRFVAESGRFSSDHRFSNSGEVVEILGWEEIVKIHWIWRIQGQMSSMCPQSVNLICFRCRIFFKKREVLSYWWFLNVFLCNVWESIFICDKCMVGFFMYEFIHSNNLEICAICTTWDSENFNTHPHKFYGLRNYICTIILW